MAEAAVEERRFSFLFRTDRGLIDRATWWRGTLPLVGIALLATLGWLALRRYTHDAIHQPPALAVLAYVYLLAFSFGTLVLLICEYNLSAKRFTARGLPRVLAAVFPFALLLYGALDWYIPRSQGLLPPWSIWGVLAVVLLVTIWNVVELGIRPER